MDEYRTNLFHLSQFCQVNKYYSHSWSFIFSLYFFCFFVVFFRFNFIRMIRRFLAHRQSFYSISFHSISFVVFHIECYCYLCGVRTSPMIFLMNCWLLTKNLFFLAITNSYSCIEILTQTICLPPLVVCCLVCTYIV